MSFPSANAGLDLQNYRTGVWKPQHAKPLTEVLDVGWHRIKVSDATTPVGAAQFFQYTSADPNAAYLGASTSQFVQQVMHPDPRFQGTQVPQPVFATNFGPVEPPAAGGGPGERVLIADADAFAF